MHIVGLQSLSTGFVALFPFPQIINNNKKNSVTVYLCVLCGSYWLDMSITGKKIIFTSRLASYCIITVSCNTTVMWWYFLKWCVFYSYCSKYYTEEDVFERSRKCSQNCNIVKHYYNLKELLVTLKALKMQYKLKLKMHYNICRFVFHVF